MTGARIGNGAAACATAELLSAGGRLGPLTTLLAALCWSLLLRRARRCGPTWGALLVLGFLACLQAEAAGRAARTELPARTSASLPAACRAERAEARAAALPSGSAAIPVCAADRPPVRSLRRRELPAPRAPDRSPRA